MDCGGDKYGKARRLPEMAKGAAGEIKAKRGGGGFDDKPGDIIHNS